MKRTIENTTMVAMFVAGHMIPPGESRDVEVPDELASAVPDGSPQPVEASTGDEPQGDGNGTPERPAQLVELQKLSVAKLKPALADLDAAQLVTLAQIEEGAEQPRSSVLDAIAAAQLKLASANTGDVI